jgi:hypothetical protein
MSTDLSRFAPALFNRRWFLLTPRQWAAVAGAALALLVLIELILRTGVVWQLPLPYLLSFSNDRFALVSWELHQPQPEGTLDVVALGSSVAAAVTELPHDEATRIVREVTARPEARLLVMAVPRGCVEDMTVILENFVNHGRTPAVALLFTWPGCFIGDSVEASLMARSMPLRTTWLLDGHDQPSSRVGFWLVQHLDILRYRYMVNAWVRRRLDGALFEGERRLRITYRPYRLADPAEVPLEQLPGFDRYHHYPDRMNVTDGNARRLDNLIAHARAAGVKVILVENPWSPPIQREFAGRVTAYTARIQAIAARHGVPYIDPNASVDLHGLYNDLLHPTHEGGRRYFRAIAPAIAAAVR